MARATILLQLILILAIASASRLWSAETSFSAPAQAVANSTAPACKMCRNEASFLNSITETKWLAPEARKKAWSKVYEVFNQNGKKFKLDELCGKPFAITFLYTRCDNPNKCSLAAATMAKLQEDARKAGIDKRIKLLILTYDPEYDLPDVLRQYAEGKGIGCGADAMMLRPDPASKNELFGELNLSVNYNANRVNIHGLQMILVDKYGRYVRSYHTLIWDNVKVLDDLKKLAEE